MNRLGHYLARKLSEPLPHFVSAVSGGKEVHWCSVVRPGDVLLVEGCSRISSVIRYLTNSTWSHACLVVGSEQDEQALVEADIAEGIVAVPMAKYVSHNVRICRPHGLTDEERSEIVGFALSQIGNQYDLHNVFDLVRYFIPIPVPNRWRQRALMFGASDPTRAICSSLVARAFQKIRYPILPISWWSSDEPMAREQIYRIRKSEYFTPRDFDLSPYFHVVKPILETDFDFHDLHWQDERADEPSLLDTSNQERTTTGGLIRGA